MPIFNMACSQQFSNALASVEAGKDIRRSSWPQGIFLRKVGERIVMIWSTQGTQTDWSGPSVHDSTAQDWQVI